MAVDEAVFKSAEAGNSPPTVRFYAWNPPAVSVGYFQDSLKEVDIKACRDLGIDVVRRLTGGRAVLHDRELTYSVICHEDDPHFPDSILGTYKVISSCLVKGLNSLGIDASLTPSVKKEGKRSPSACFTSPSHYEITVDGKKLVGSAQRRGEGVFLQHGSILMEFDRCMLERVLPQSGRLDCVTFINRYIRIGTEGLIPSLVKGFEEVLGISFSEGSLSSEEMALAERYVDERYSRPEWNLRRGPACWAPTLP
jgi:lipoate-protein ligase A